jgi:hypothetical protein
LTSVPRQEKEAFALKREFLRGTGGQAKTGREYHGAVRQHREAVRSDWNNRTENVKKPFSAAISTANAHEINGRIALLAGALAKRCGVR